MNCQQTLKILTIINGIMMRTYWRLAFFIMVFLMTASGCYRHPNLNGETIGSLAGSVGGGLLAAGSASGNLILIGAGTITGSILGGIVGAAFDDMDRVHQADPALWPIVMDCYQTRRPTYMASYCPGISMPPDDAQLYQHLIWADYPSDY